MSTVTIPIRLSGDYWVNDEELESAVIAVPPTHLVDIDFLGEGVSTTASGIVTRLEQICTRTGRDLRTVRFVNNPNLSEQTPFYNANRQFPVFRSHFFPMSRAYWRDVPAVQSQARPFGFFIGRRTVARGAMLYQCWTEMPERFLFSAMRSRTNGVDPDLHEIPQWFDAEQTVGFQSWCSQWPVTSIDDRTVADQYVPNATTNASILDFYDRFHIELVAETYVRGDTFFPTEKTVRPLMAAKPILVYGPKRFLSRLRDLGFQTYHTVWDESYDDLEGAARWHSIKNIMANIDIDKASHAMQSIAIYNRHHLDQMIQS